MAAHHQFIVPLLLLVLASFSTSQAQLSLPFKENWEDTTNISARWALTTGGAITIPCQAASSLNALAFTSASSVRTAQTQLINTVNAGTLNFKIVLGGAGCASAPTSAQTVNCEYQVQGTSTWTLLQNVPQTVTTSTLYQISLPVGAKAAAVAFRWNQVGLTGAAVAFWALDDIYLETVFTAAPTEFSDSFDGSNIDANFWQFSSNAAIVDDYCGRRALAFNGVGDALRMITTRTLNTSSYLVNNAIPTVYSIGNVNSANPFITAQVGMSSITCSGTPRFTFIGSSARYLQTRSFDVRNGGSVTFTLVMNLCFSTQDPSRPVQFYYATDCSSFQFISQYNYIGSQTFTVVLPAGARGPATCFRFSAIATQAGYNYWSLDLFNLASYPAVNGYAPTGITNFLQFDLNTGQSNCGAQTSSPSSIIIELSYDNINYTPVFASLEEFYMVNSLTYPISTTLPTPAFSLGWRRFSVPLYNFGTATLRIRQSLSSASFSSLNTWALDNVYFGMTCSRSCNNFGYCSVSQQQCICDNNVNGPSCTPAYQYSPRETFNTNVPAGWSLAGAVVTETGCGMRYDRGAINFNGASYRYAETPDIDPTGYVAVQFALQFGGSCATATTNGLYMSYSVNGGTSWTLMYFFYTNIYQTSTPTVVVIPLTGLRSQPIRFKWQQFQMTTANQDVWMLDNFALLNATILPSVGVDFTTSFNTADVLFYPGGAVQSSVYCSLSQAIMFSRTDVNLRFITTNDVQFVTAAASLEVILKMGNNMCGGSSLVTKADDLLLEYTTNYGTAWTSIARISAEQLSYSTVPIRMVYNVPNNNQLIYRFRISQPFTTDYSIYNQWAVARLRVGDSCPNNCNGFGSCLTGTCVCDLGSSLTPTGSCLPNVQTLPTSLSDKFEWVIYPLSTWSVVVGGTTVTTPCGVNSDGTSLTMNGPGHRFLISAPVDTTNVLFAQFVFGSGSSSCALTPTALPVHFQYSNDNGITWTDLVVINTTLGTRQPLSLPMPLAARTSGTRFQFTQDDPASPTSDQWSIDDLYIGGNGAQSNPSLIVDLFNPSVASNYRFTPNGAAATYCSTPSMKFAGTTGVRQLNIVDMTASGAAADFITFDDFSSGSLDFTNKWFQVVGGTPSTGFGGCSAMNPPGSSLVFTTNAFPRLALMQPVDARHIDSLRFLFRLGDATCTVASPGAEVSVRYSFDRSTWYTLMVLSVTAYQVTTPIFINLLGLTPSIQVSSVYFQWIQSQNGGTNNDVWGLDDVAFHMIPTSNGTYISFLLGFGLCGGSTVASPDAELQMEYSTNFGSTWKILAPTCVTTLTNLCDNLPAVTRYSPATYNGVLRRVIVPVPLGATSNSTRFRVVQSASLTLTTDNTWTVSDLYIGTGCANYCGGFGSCYNGSVCVCNPGFTLSGLNCVPSIPLKSALVETFSTYNASIWLPFVGGAIDNVGCGPLGDGSQLYFSGSLRRFAETVDLDTTSATYIQFQLGMGLGLCTVAPLSTQQINVMYSNNGGMLWTVSATPANLNGSITIGVRLPPLARAAAVRFRIEQISTNGAALPNGGFFAIDNFLLTTSTLPTVIQDTFDPTNPSLYSLLNNAVTGSNFCSSSSNVLALSGSSGFRQVNIVEMPLQSNTLTIFSDNFDSSTVINPSLWQLTRGAVIVPSTAGCGPMSGGNYMLVTGTQTVRNVVTKTMNTTLMDTLRFTFRLGGGDGCAVATIAQQVLLSFSSGASPFIQIMALGPDAYSSAVVVTVPFTSAMRGDAVTFKWEQTQNTNLAEWALDNVSIFHSQLGAVVQFDARLGACAAAGVAEANPDNTGDVRVMYSLDTGNTWQYLYAPCAIYGSLTCSSQISMNAVIRRNEFSSYRRVTLPLPEAASSDRTMIRIEQVSTNLLASNVWAIDNLFVGPCVGYCNGHGYCKVDGTCQCDAGYTNGGDGNCVLSAPGTLPTELRDTFERTAPANPAIWSLITGGVISSSGCGVNADGLQLLMNGSTVRSMDTVDMNAVSVTVMTFALKAGGADGLCASGSRQPLSVLYSIDGGVFWTFLTVVPLVDAQRSVSISIPVEARVASVRFRIVQQNIDSPLLDVWAIDNFWITGAVTALPSVIRDNFNPLVETNYFFHPGAVSTSSFCGQSNALLFSGNSALQLNPIDQNLTAALPDFTVAFADNFNVNLSTTYWTLTNGNLSRPNTDCGPVQGGKYLLMALGTQRIVAFRGVDLTNVASVTFFIRVGGGGQCDSVEVGEEVSFQYRPTSVAAWTTLLKMGGDLYGVAREVVVDMTIQNITRTSTGELRWIQTATGSALDEWGLDGIVIYNSAARLNTTLPSGSFLETLVYVGACNTSVGSSSSLSAPAVTVTASNDAGASFFDINPIPVINTLSFFQLPGVVYASSLNKWRRLVIPISTRTVGSLTRLQISQNSAAGSSFALAGLYIGNECPNFCNGHGSCMTGSCVCDSGYILQFGTCNPASTRPYGLRTGFEETEPANVAVPSSTVWLQDVLGGILAPLSPPLLGFVGTVLQMNAGPVRYFETVDIDTTSGGSIQFLLALGSKGDQSALNGNNQISLLFSRTGGVLWQLAATITTPGTQYIVIPTAAQSNSTRFRLQQFAYNATRDADIWLVDNVYISGNLTRPPQVLADNFNPAPNSRLYINSLNAVSGDFCGTSPALVFSGTVPSVRQIDTVDMNVTSGGVMQFELMIGGDCVPTPDTTSEDYVDLLVSVDRGVTWSPVNNNTCLTLQADCTFTSEYTLGVYSLGFQRVSLVIPNSISSRGFARFRFTQNPSVFTTTNAWALRRLYIGNDCSSLCVGRGACINASCVCDSGYVLVSGQCLPQSAPATLRDEFEYSVSNVTAWSSIWSNIVGGQTVSAASGCGPMASGLQLLMTGGVKRILITVDLDTRNASVLQFLLNQGVNGCSTLSASTSIDVMYSINAGLTWRSVINIPSNAGVRQVYTLLPVAAKTIGTRFRIEQQVFTAGSDFWAVDNLYVGPQTNFTVVSNAFSSATFPSPYFTFAPNMMPIPLSVPAPANPFVLTKGLTSSGVNGLRYFDTFNLVMQPAFDSFYNVPLVTETFESYPITNNFASLNTALFRNFFTIYGTISNNRCGPLTKFGRQYLLMSFGFNTRLIETQYMDATTLDVLRFTIRMGSASLGTCNPVLAGHYVELLYTFDQTNYVSMMRVNGTQALNGTQYVIPLPSNVQVSKVGFRLVTNYAASTDAEVWGLDDWTFAMPGVALVASQTVPAPLSSSASFVQFHLRIGDGSTVLDDRLDGVSLFFSTDGGQSWLPFFDFTMCTVATKCNKIYNQRQTVFVPSLFQTYQRVTLPFPRQVAVTGVRLRFTQQNATTLSAANQWTIADLYIGNECSGYCNGHGICNSSGICVCDFGYGLVNGTCRPTAALPTSLVDTFDTTTLSTAVWARVVGGSVQLTPLLCTAMSDTGYMLMSGNASRVLETVDMNTSTSQYLQFYIASGRDCVTMGTGISPVNLYYSIDGGVSFLYFSSVPITQNSSFVSLAIPALALTTATRFRFEQYPLSPINDGRDWWAIDDLVIAGLLSTLSTITETFSSTTLDRTKFLFAPNGLVAASYCGRTNNALVFDGSLSQATSSLSTTNLNLTTTSSGSAVFAQFMLATGCSGNPATITLQYSVNNGQNYATVNTECITPQQLQTPGCSTRKAPVAVYGASFGNWSRITVVFNSINTNNVRLRWISTGTRLTTWAIDNIYVGSDCPGYCNGVGSCNSNGTCTCDPGFVSSGNTCVRNVSLAATALTELMDTFETISNTWARTDVARLVSTSAGNTAVIADGQYFELSTSTETIDIVGTNATFVQATVKGGADDLVVQFSVDSGSTWSYLGVFTAMGTSRYAPATTSLALPPAAQQPILRLRFVTTLANTVVDSTKGMLLTEWVNNDFTGTVAATVTINVIDISSTTLLLASSALSARVFFNLVVPTTGFYTFVLASVDGSRLYINNQLVIDNWRVQSLNTVLSNSVYLESIYFYNIRVEYFRGATSTTAVLNLKWTGPDFKNAVLVNQTYSYISSTAPPFASPWRLDNLFIGGARALTTARLQETFDGSRFSALLFTPNLLTNRTFCGNNVRGLVSAAIGGNNVVLVPERALYSREMLFSATGGMIELSIALGCAESDLTEIALQYSITSGSTWADVVPDCLSCSQPIPTRFNSVDSPATYTRYVFPFPSFLVGVPVRFRVVQTKGFLTNAGWALLNMYIGTDCTSQCGGHGSCITAACACDSGFSFDSFYRTCTLVTKRLPQYFRSSFDRSNFGDDAPLLAPLGKYAQANACNFAPAFDGVQNQYLFTSSTSGYFITPDLNTVDTTVIEFDVQLPTISGCTVSPTSSAAVMLYASTNGGVSWTSLWSGTSSNHISISLGFYQRVSACRFMWVLTPRATVYISWSIDNIYIGGPINGRTQLVTSIFESFESASLAGNIWLSTTNPINGSNICTGSATGVLDLSRNTLVTSTVPERVLSTSDMDSSVGYATQDPSIFEDFSASTIDTTKWNSVSGAAPSSQCGQDGPYGNALLFNLSPTTSRAAITQRINITGLNTLTFSLYLANDSSITACPPVDPSVSITLAWTSDLSAYTQLQSFTTAGFSGRRYVTVSLASIAGLATQVYFKWEQSNLVANGVGNVWSIDSVQFGATIPSDGGVPITAAAFAQFDYFTMCTTLASPAAFVSILISTNRGQSWSNMSACIDTNCVRMTNAVSFQFSKSPSLRVTIPLILSSKTVTVSRFAVSRVNAAAAAVDNLFIGVGCTNQCSGHGRCYSGACRCDPGYNGTLCANSMLTLPTNLVVSSFASLSSSLFADWSVNAQVGSFCDNTGVVYFSGTGSRYLETVDLDLQTVSQVVFSVKVGSSVTASCRNASIAAAQWIGLYYSTNGGVLWTRLSQTVPSTSLAQVTVTLPSLARVAGVRLRFWQAGLIGVDTGHWIISQITIGSATALTCGDGYCAGGETCQSCPTDCDCTVAACTTNPCLNGGRCVALGASLSTCSCPAGYTGQTCQWLDACLAAPCGFSGTCTSTGSNLFTCQCALGFNGTTCDQNLSACLSSPCVNGATCTPLPSGTYKCDCGGYFLGTNCESSILCASSPCVNSGTCLPRGTRQQFCACASGYSGLYCEYFTGEVNWSGNVFIPDRTTISAPIVLPQYGTITSVTVTIVNLVHTYIGDLTVTIQNPAGVTATLIPQSSGAAGGDNLINTVFTDSAPTAFTTVTPSSAPFTGQYRPVDSLVTKFKCGNSAGTWTLYVADCCATDTGTLYQWKLTISTGPNCASGCPVGLLNPPSCTEQDDCLSNPCQNLAVCVDGTVSYSCQCTPGFTGRLCDVEINECTSSPCQNGASCVNLVGFYQCVCPLGFLGYNCDFNVACSSSPCLNGGLCSTIAGTFSCNCSGTGFEGAVCGIQTDQCRSSPCANGGLCSSALNTFSCDCRSTFFIGSTCTVPNYPCLSSPCQNGATCSQFILGGVPQFNCSCPARFFGALCQLDEVCTGGLFQTNSQLNSLSGCAVISGSLTIKGSTLTSITSLAPLSALRNLTGMFVFDSNSHSSMTDFSVLAAIQYVGGIRILNCESLSSLNGLQKVRVVGGDVAISDCPFLTDLTGLDTVSRITGSLSLVRLGSLTSIQKLSVLTAVDGSVLLDSNSNLLTLNGLQNLTSIGANLSITSMSALTSINHAHSIATIGGYLRISSNPVLVNLTSLNAVRAIGSFLSIALNGPIYVCPEFISRLQNVTLGQSSGAGTVAGISGQIFFGVVNVTVGLTCHNGGVCAATSTTEFVCVCRAEFTGTQCDLISDVCASSPCQNGGTCVRADLAVRAYTCTCPTNLGGDVCDRCTPGRYGVDCSSLCSSFCLNSLCDNSFASEGACLACPSGRYGYACLTCKSCNNGVCDQGRNGTGNCLCNPGYTGTVCDQDIDECSSSPCAHGGVCSNLLAMFQCNCGTSGYGGEQCLDDVDECGNPALNLCSSNTTTNVCFNNIGAYQCGCTTGYYGAVTSKAKANCVPCDCDPAGSVSVLCTNVTGVCTCKAGYTGRNCATLIQNFCPSPYTSTVLHANVTGAGCSSGRLGDTCTHVCTGVYILDSNAGSPVVTCTSAGTWSSTQALCNLQCPMVPAPVGGGPVCDATQIDGVICEQFCDLGYTLSGSSQRVCSNGNWTKTPVVCTEINECLSQPCLNNGTCNDLLNGWSCNCTTTNGYTGNVCQSPPIVPTSPCVSTPCLNGGACLANGDLSAFICDCTNTGFNGSLCDVNLDECLSNPCRHGGRCIDGIRMWTCSCAGTGYSGIVCEVEIRECDSSPCQNGATCVDKINSFSCTCASGYFGTLCAAQTDYCVSQPCTNGGSCLNILNGFTCACSAGFTGTTCASTILYCISNPCLNGGSCSNQLGQFTCSCVAGYTGTICQTNINECASQPCLNLATCADGINSYLCSCLGGYTGIQCETDVNECASAPCFDTNSNGCQDGINLFVCACRQGFTGVSCQTNINECASQPCLNLATCADGVNSYTCNCVPGFTGMFCETDINECNSAPCLNGATCVDLVNAFACSCIPGFTGQQCTTNINECASNPCTASVSSCVEGINSFICVCNPAYTGVLCETFLDDCASTPCANGGTCHVGVTSYSCECAAGFTGVYCATNIDECASSPCVTGSTCADGVNSFLCNCILGFTGSHCETDINECLSNPCFGISTCVDTLNAFTCVCSNGFTGSRCQTNIDDCVGQPCANGGTCNDGVTSFTCSCALGFTGTLCNTDINECVSSPCSNAAVCTDAVNGYSCACPAGFTGAFCQTDINECLSNPCGNLGTCTNQVNAFTCTCVPGYTGSGCQTNIDDCLPQPCQHGATCQDGLASYGCVCVTGYTGSRCETNIDDCLSSPCANEGTCIDGVNSYSCSCLASHSGTLCETVIDMTLCGQVRADTTLSKDVPTGSCGVGVRIPAGSVSSSVVIQVFAGQGSALNGVSMPSGGRLVSNYTRIEPSGTQFNSGIYLEMEINEAISDADAPYIVMYSSSNGGPFLPVANTYYNRTTGRVVGTLMHLSVMGVFMVTPGSSSSSSSLGLAVGAAVGGVCALLLIILIVILVRRRRGNQHKAFSRVSSIRPQSLYSHNSMSRNEKVDESLVDETVNPLVFGRGREGSVQPLVNNDSDNMEMSFIAKSAAKSPTSSAAALPTVAETTDYLDFMGQSSVQAYVEMSDYADRFDDDYGSVDNYTYGNAEEQRYRPTDSLVSASDISGVRVSHLSVQGSQDQQQRHAQIFENLPRLDHVDDEYGYDDEHETMADCLPEKQFPRNALSFEMEIGKGNFGFVLKASWEKNGVREYVGVKTLNANVKDVDRQSFLAEAQTMASLQHPNIMELVGVCMDREPWLIVMPFAEHGDLRTLLRKAKKTNFSITLAEKLKICIQISKGLEYLSKQLVLHRDMAARNCLVFGGSLIRIADFGLAVRLPSGTPYYEVAKGSQLPVRWTAPEVILTGQHHFASDVWALGVTLWEVFTQGTLRPYGNTPTTGLLTYLKDGGRLICPSDCPLDVFGTITSCWELQLHQRISVTTLVGRLRDLLLVHNEERGRDFGGGLATHLKEVSASAPEQQSKLAPVDDSQL